MGCHAVSTSSGKIALRFRWTQPDGRQRYFSVTTPYEDRDQAMKKAAVIGAEIRAGEFDPLRHFEPAAPRFGVEPPASRAPQRTDTLPAALEAWADRKERRGVRVSRVRDYRSHLDNYIRPALGELVPDGLTAKVLEDFQLWLLTQAGEDRDGVSEKTAGNVIRGTLRAFVRDQRGDLAPFDSLTWERYAPARQQEPFEAEERDRLLAWFRAKRSFAEYVSLRLRFIGASPSEARGFNVGDFSRSTGTLAVRRSRHLGVTGATKTVARGRAIVLGDVAADVEFICGLRQPDKPLLDVAEDTLRDNFTKAQIALGIHHRSLYQAKHTYAVLSLVGGESPALVARNLGIALATLEKHYAAALRRGRESRDSHQGLHQGTKQHG